MVSKFDNISFLYYLFNMKVCANSKCKKRKPNFLKTLIFPKLKGIEKGDKWFCSRECYVEWLVTETIKKHKSREYISESRMKLGMLLLDKGVITPTQLQIALKEQEKTGKKLGAILLKSGYIDEQNLLSALSKQYGISFINVDNLKEVSSPIGFIPKEIIFEFNLFPFLINKKEKFVNIVISDPSDLRLLISFFNEILPGYKISFFLGDFDKVEELILEFFPEKKFKFSLPEEYKSLEIENRIMEIIDFLSNKKDVKNFSFNYLDESLWLKFDWGNVGCDFYFTQKGKEKS